LISGDDNTLVISLDEICCNLGFRGLEKVVDVENMFVGM